MAALLCGVFISTSGWAAATAPRVVVSVAPVHALVAGVMAGVGTPELLIPIGTSPHAFSLRPSQRRAIESAELLIWVGPSLEPFLRKPAAELADKIPVIELIGQREVSLAPAREAGIFAEAAHADVTPDVGRKHEHGHGVGHGDPHIWLDPENATAIVHIVTGYLVRLSPAFEARYTANAQQLIDRITQLDAQIKVLLADVRDVPYVVFHDAYQSFERHYDLRPVAAISVSPAIMPGTRRVLAIRRSLKEQRVRCVFSEPQFEPRLLDALTDGLQVRRGVLDPLGGEEVLGENAWLAMMRGIATNLHRCLAGL
ncbi:MAG: zinc transport system substrate-binding protein [Gammaproteobacteria bacterium]|jgi:zinc transport system substrate-binding protein